MSQDNSKNYCGIRENTLTELLLIEMIMVNRILFVHLESTALTQHFPIDNDGSQL